MNQVGPNALFKNRGDGTFEDATEISGLGIDNKVSSSGSFADIDNDGDQDLHQLLHPLDHREAQPIHYH